ncbi:epithelial chloride channel protein-like [Sinocyclocheilus rhinocerous]|uniref:epithelial chloride channel protein-like n=1 Tax=Sinocyclocheilus rhinocerous TaxID=307959 RepID=UPI0007BA2919|nr:PREDICTED: epithelial chloride channel protein-like [Sinocyclocheilus rhinocerous]
MDSRTVFVLLWMLLSSTSTGIKLDGNGYVDVVIAISSKVPQDIRLIDKIKEMVTEGSFYLYDALDEKVYFREATILVPPQWNGTNFTKARTESFGKAKIRIDNANPAYGVEPYTNQYGECGAEGEYIHFTPEYLLNDTLIELYGSRGRVFVHEWAHVRWGVYDECNGEKPFYHSNGHIEATRCSKNIEGQFYEVTAGGSLQQCRIDPQTSLPTKGCMFFPDRNQITNSSIMFLPGLDPLESIGARTSDLFNGTVSVDQTVGNKTSFVIIYENSLPSIYIQSPSGLIYTQTNMNHDVSQKTVTLNIPGTAESGDWKYSIQTKILQAFTITVTSQVAQADVPPIIVKTHMNQQFSDGTKPMIVFAEVSQNYRPVIKAEVWATLESETGSVHTLQLLDNGAGADAFQDDGIYSRYFIKMVNGRSSLKVRVKNQSGQTRFAVLYVPGCVINGVVKLNPPKPPVFEEPLDVGNFTRTDTGESFEVKLSGTAPPNFPPNRITDLSAEIQEDTVLLNWTAPGEDLDQGTAKTYKIRWSFDLKMLRFNFSNGHSVNTTAVSPQEAGSVEQHSFNLNITIQNGTTLFFAVQSEDKQKAKSETSNIAQASKILPAPKPPGISNPGMILVLVISLCVVTMVICFIVAVVICAVKRRKRSAQSDMALIIANECQNNLYA